MFKAVGVYYRFFSRKFPTQERIRKIIGGSLLTLGVLAGFFAPSATAYTNTRTLDHLSTAQFTPVETTTLIGLQFPLKNYSVGQYFSFFHPGIDLDAQAQTPVYPIAEGKVEKITYSSWGYGRHVMVNHDNGFQSLYAHLSTIAVEVGEKINKETLLGGVGSTGWTTGSHLHLEVWQNGKPLNPLEILSEKEK